jgi:hypothetical protein
MEGADPRTDGELLVATATDPEAFATFYRRHVRGLLASIVLTDEGIERVSRGLWTMRSQMEVSGDA